MHRSALLAFGAWLAASGVANAQGLPEGVFASSKEGCDKLKEKTVAELGQDLDFTVLRKTGTVDHLQRCDFLGVTARNATSWLATAFCEEPAYAFPDLFAIVQKESGELSVTRMTVQQESFDETDEDPSLLADDLDPAEIGPDAGADSDDSPPPEAGTASEVPPAADNLDIYVRCESVKQ